MFLDGASLSANPDLWDSIEVALDASRWYVLLASPKAAHSKWVRQELEYWLEHKSLDQLLIVVTEGQVGAGPAASPQAAALPELLTSRLVEEPRFVDLRWARRGENLTLRDPRFREAVADLAAPIHGRPKDEMIGEEVRQHRRTVRLARAAVAALGVLTLLAVAAAVLAVRGQNTARAERDRAEQQARLATARQLAAESGAALGEDDLDAALLTAAQSYRMEPTPQGRDALLASFAAVPRLRTILHTPAATRRTISSDGQRVALLTADDRVEVRQLSDIGSAEGRFSVPPATLAMAMSPEGQVLATASERGDVSIFDVAGRSPPRRFAGQPQDLGEESPSQTTSIAVAPRGRLVAWNGVDISVWNGREKQTLRPGLKPPSWLLAFGAEGSLLAAGSTSDGSLVIWELDSSGRPLGAPTELTAGSGEAPTLAFGPGIASLAFSPTDPDRIAIGGYDATVSVWDWRSKTLIARGHAGRGTVSSLAFSPDGRRLASVGETGVQIWNVERRAATSSLPEYSSSYALAFGGDASELIGAGPDGTVTRWGLDDDPYPLGRRLDGPDSEVQSLAYDPRGRLLVTASYNGARLWDAATLHPLRSLGGTDNAMSAAFAPGGGTLAMWPRTADAAGVALGTARGIRAAGGALRSVSDVVFIRGRALAAAGAGRGVAIWDVRARRKLTSLASSAAAARVELAPGGHSAAGVTGEGKALRLWNADTGRVVNRALPGGAPASIAFTHDGRTLANSSWDNATIRLRDAATGRDAGRLAGGGNADAIAFDRNGRLLASATYDFTPAGETRTIQLWDVARRERLGAEPLATGPGGGRFSALPQVEFSPDGRTLAAIGLDARPLFFNLRESSWPAVACRIAGRDLSRTEWRRLVGPGFDYEPTCPSG